MLREIGDWMAVNAEAIHGARPVAPYKEGRVALNGKGRTVYTIYKAAEGETGLPGASLCRRCGCARAPRSACSDRSFPSVGLWTRAPA